jgi:hypothetical protein
MNKQQLIKKYNFVFLYMCFGSPRWVGKVYGLTVEIGKDAFQREGVLEAEIEGAKQAYRNNTIFPKFMDKLLGRN